MFDFISYLSVIEYRMAEALLAVAIIIAWQFCMVAISVATKQCLSPLPVLHLILTPICNFFSLKLNKDNRSAFALIIRGALVLLLCMTFASMVIGFFTFVSQYLNAVPEVNIVLLCFVLSPIYPAYLALILTKKKRQDGALYNLSYGLNLNMIHEDQHGIRRNGFRLLAVSITDWFIAPLILYILFGNVCVYAYASISVLAYSNSKRPKAELFLSLFAICKSIIDTIVNVFLILLSFFAAAITSKGRPLLLFKSFKHTGTHLAPYAYALNIALGGTAQDRHGNTKQMPWIGPARATAKIINSDVHRGVIMHAVIILLATAILIAAYIYGFNPY